VSLHLAQLLGCRGSWSQLRLELASELGKYLLPTREIEVKSAYCNLAIVLLWGVELLLALIGSDTG